MPVTVNWDNDMQTVLCFRITEHWTWEEFCWAWLESAEMVSSLSYKVNLIVEFTEVMGLHLNGLTQIVNIIHGQTHNFGTATFVYHNNFVDLRSPKLNPIALPDKIGTKVAALSNR